MEKKLKVFSIDCEGVIYHVSGKTQEEAINHLEEKEIEWNGGLECPKDKWLIEEVIEPFPITYDELDDNGEILVIMSNDLIEGKTKPEIMSCSEW